MKIRGNAIYKAKFTNFITNEVEIVIVVSDGYYDIEGLAWQKFVDHHIKNNKDIIDWELTDMIYIGDVMEGCKIL